MVNERLFRGAKCLDRDYVANEDLPCFTYRSSVTKVVYDRSGHVGSQRKFKLSLCLRLRQDNPVFTPTNILESKTTDIG